MKISKKMIAAVAAVALYFIFSHKSPSDQELRSKVVQLEGNGSLCSGEQVRAPSGIDYVVSAAHCGHLATNGSILVKTEDGRQMERRVIAEDIFSDLLLIEGIPNMKGLDIAQSSYNGEPVRTLTHGRGFPTYETKGILIASKKIKVPLFDIMSPEDEIKCNLPKHKIDENWFGKSCMLNVSEMATTALIAPGSSGGMVIDMSGKLVGVVSAGDSVFGYMVTLDDIHRFLANY